MRSEGLSGKSVFFASDFHLGLRGAETPIEREKRIVRWLLSIEPQAEALYLLGDIFDFWYEYRGVVPRGHTRFLATLARFTDLGIPVHIFTGNHDVWMFDYLEREVGATIHRAPQVVQLLGKTFHLAHGDGLGPTGFGYRLLRTLFHSRIMQRLFAALVHPSFAMWLGSTWSHRSRYAKQHSHSFRGDQEPVAIHALSHPLASTIHCFMVGHLHMARLHYLPTGKHLLILGDWIVSNSYAQWDGQQLRLLQYHDHEPATLLASCSLDGEVYAANSVS